MSREEDRAFLRNFMGVIALLMGITIALILVATLFFGGLDEQAQKELAANRAETNLKPVGDVRLSGEPMPEVANASGGAGSGEPRSGEEVVQAVCAACHNGNFMNAPQVGNKDQWAPRIDAGMAKLVSQVKNGYGNMPAQGSAATDDEIRKAINWMVEEKTGLNIPKG